MNNELENKLKSLTDLAKNFGFGKEEAVKLAKNLISEYKISFADLYPDMSARFEEVKELCGKIQKTANGLNEKIETRSETSEPKGVTLPFEVIYAGGIRSKQTIYMITPYFTKFHARIVALCKYFLRIIITCYPCIIITEIGRNRIRKVVTEYLQIIMPCGRKFISFCPQVRRVHLRRSGTIYSGKLNTIGKHINGISHINVSGKIQTIVEHR